MISAIRAEFRKLLTVRSTYIVTALVIVLLALIAGYVEGWRLGSSDLLNPNLLMQDVLGGMSLIVFGAIIAILLMTHEYRYNTIMYTLTSSKSRSKVLVAKIVVISVFALCLTILIGVLSPIFSLVGLHIHGNSLVPQTFHVWDVVWRSLFYGWAYGMAGLLLAVLIRSQVGAIAALFLIPGLIEQLLGQLLKNSAKYLPFTALDGVTNNGQVAANALSPGKSAFVFMCYLVVGWVVAGVLFAKRDAN